MHEFDDALPERKFDNFQFLALTEVLEAARAGRAKGKGQAAAGGATTDDAADNLAIAAAAFQEIPDQFSAIRQLGYLG